MTDTRPLRRDAQRNRDLLVAAAGRIFAARGLDVPLEDVAREAGVSIGTLYNRFPTRGALVDATLVGKVAETVEFAQAAATMADPWTGFAWFLEHSCQLRATDRGFNELCARAIPDTPEIDVLTKRGHQLILEILDRAHRSGQLRADFGEGDLAFVIWSIGRTIEATCAHAPQAWRRHLAFMLDGFRAGAATPLPQPPLSRDEVVRAMHTLAD